MNNRMPLTADSHVAPRRGENPGASSYRSRGSNQQPVISEMLAYQNERMKSPTRETSFGLQDEMLQGFTLHIGPEEPKATLTERILFAAVCALGCLFFLYAIFGVLSAVILNISGALS